MGELRLVGGVLRVLVVVGAVFDVAVLNAGAASADGPVQLKSRLGDVCLDAPSGSWFSPLVINPCMGPTFSAGISPMTGRSRAWPSPGNA